MGDDDNKYDKLRNYEKHYSGSHMKIVNDSRDMNQIHNSHSISKSHLLFQCIIPKQNRHISRWQYIQRETNEMIESKEKQISICKHV